MGTINFNFLSHQLTIKVQEMYSTKENEIKRKGEFGVNLYFSHGKTKFIWSTNRFFWQENFYCEKQPCDENGQILILETLIDDSQFIFITFYNTNTESEQFQTCNELNMLLSNLDLSGEKLFASLRVNFLIAPGCKQQLSYSEKTLFK